MLLDPMLLPCSSLRGVVLVSGSEGQMRLRALVLLIRVIPIDWAQWPVIRAFVPTVAIG
jgi:hypothetical protein